MSNFSTFLLGALVAWTPCVLLFIWFLQQAPDIESPE
jgi:hypothetical protein